MIEVLVKCPICDKLLVGATNGRDVAVPKHGHAKALDWECRGGGAVADPVAARKVE
jgi:hypothetical protein